MAGPPILTLSDVAVTFGGAPLIQGATLAVHPGEAICLVGRNGSGKSTLMKLMAGLVQPDSGTRFWQPGLTAGYMAQDPDFSGFPTLRAFAERGIDATETYRVDIALETVGLDGNLAPAAASGGERRRAALARLLAQTPDLMLLDEPTNHLDISATLRLERHLADARSAFVVISHDRTFLRNSTERTFWIDRGEVRTLDQGFAAFEAWRDKLYDEEDAARHKLDRLIEVEARWAVEGISARRRRNQGRVRRLGELRDARRAQIARQGAARMAFGAAAVSGRLVIEADGISKTFQDRVVVRDFSLRIGRGERVAVVGPNGAGKTTLLRMLTGELAPDAGTVRLGTGLVAAVFDQDRATLDPDATLWDTLVGGSAQGVTGRSDQVMVRGRPRHVVGYLKEFLFAEAQARGPVSALSGGERARLLLALLMARASNLLVLDEPTNDLDVETLDLLQELVDDYAGTVLLVSHDRDFLDRVATTTIALEGDGRAMVYAGGWTDYQAQARPAPAPEAARKATPSRQPVSGPPLRPPKLSFKHAHRLAMLPAEIDRLSTEVARLEALLADPQLYNREPEKFRRASTALAASQASLGAAENEWLELEELRASLEAASD